MLSNTKTNNLPHTKCSGDLRSPVDLILFRYSKQAAKTACFFVKAYLHHYQKKRPNLMGRFYFCYNLLSASILCGSASICFCFHKGLPYLVIIINHHELLSLIEGLLCPFPPDTDKGCRALRLPLFQGPDKLSLYP